MKIIRKNFSCEKCNNNFFADCGKYWLCSDCFRKHYKELVTEKVEVKKSNIPIDTISYNKELFAKNVTELFFEKHNIYNWNFKLNRKKSACGTCNYTHKVISLSKYYLKNAKIDDIINTILHEIAHVLTPRHHHDRIWKSVALSIGNSGTRTNPNATRIEGKVKYQCKKCGEVVTFHRTLKNKKAHGKCCYKYNNNKFSWDYELVKIT